MKWRLACLALAYVAAAAASGQIVVPGADGSDGPFDPNASIQVDLSLAVNRAWDEPSPVPGHGVYDYEKWAVVFKYSSVTIPAGVTVTFKNHPSGAPVVWLVSGDVQLNGTIDLRGQAAIWSPVTEALPGPGGFRGGKPPQQHSDAGAGFGPGGAGVDNKAGGYGTCGASNCTDVGEGRRYGNPAILPLMGGSGGAGGWHWAHPWPGGGGAGGGTILIAAPLTITLAGDIVAPGGSGCYIDGIWGYSGAGGSGGAIRLIAYTITGDGLLRATGGGGCIGGGAGRIRIEANDPAGLVDHGDPTASFGLPGAVATLWPASDAPSVRIASVGPVQIPTDPRARLDFPHADATLTDPNSAAVLVEATNVPLDWIVIVYITARNGGNRITAPATWLSTNGTSSLWQATVDLPSGFSALQARASSPIYPPGD